MTALFNVVLVGAPKYRVYLTGSVMDDVVASGLVATAVRNGF
jgi:hypothetical protein